MKLPAACVVAKETGVTDEEDEEEVKEGRCRGQGGEGCYPTELT
jgi:hypothetical protein